MKVQSVLRIHHSPFRNPLLPLLLFLIVLPPASAAWEQFQGDGGRSGASGAILNGTVSVAWSVSCSLAEGTSPLIGGGRVVIAEQKGPIRVLDPADGSLVRTIIPPGRAVSTPVINGSSLFVLAGDDEKTVLAGYSLADGSMLWNTTIEDRSQGDGLGFDGTLLWVVTDSELLGIDPADGRIRWVFEESTVTALHQSGHLLSIGETGLTSYSTATGRMEWSAALSGRARDAVAGGNRLFVALEKGMEARSAATGGLLWQSALVPRQMAVRGDTVAVTGAEGHLRLLDAATGATRAVAGGNLSVTVPPVITPDGVLASESRALLALSPAGELLWRLPFDAGLNNPLAAADGMVVLEAGSTLYAVAVRAAEPPKEDGAPVARLQAVALESPYGRPLNLTSGNGTVSRLTAGDALVLSGAASRSSTSTILLYRFTFGDGGPSMTVNSSAPVSHRFAAKGEYSVSLDVMDAAGRWSAPAALAVRVENLRPVVDVARPAAGTAGAEVNFTFTAFDPDGAVSYYRMDYDGDGTDEATGAGAPPARASYAGYGRPGTYTARLCVRDDFGADACAAATVAVLDAPPTVSPASPPPEAPASPPPATPTPAPHSALPAPRSAPVPIVPAASAAAVGALVAAGLATEHGRFAALKFLVVPLYVRLRKDSVLDQYTRGKIHGYIVANPGEHYSSIKEALDLPNGVISYHLATLEREGVIKSLRDGMYRRFYPARMKVDLDRDGPLSIQRIIFNQVRESPGINQSELAARVHLSRATVNYHVGVLVSAGFLRTERVGRNVLCRVAGYGKGAAAGGTGVPADARE